MWPEYNCQNHWHGLYAKELLVCLIFTLSSPALKSLVNQWMGWIDSKLTCTACIDLLYIVIHCYILLCVIVCVIVYVYYMLYIVIYLYL